MSIFVIQSNPVGVATNLLDGKVMELKALWDAEVKPTSKWWQIFSKERIMAANSFFLNCVDQLIIHIDQFKAVPGQDKKATVLLAAVIIYDYVVSQTLPLFLKPFSNQIKQIAIYVVLSYMIDFIVKKYNDGLWSKNEIQTTNP